MAQKERNYSKQAYLNDLDSSSEGEAEKQTKQGNVVYIGQVAMKPKRLTFAGLLRNSMTNLTP